MLRPAIQRVVTATLVLISLSIPPTLRAQDIPEMSAEAAAAFAEGMAHYTSAEYQAAAEDFARAYQTDPSFAVAAFFEGLNWGNAGNAERAADAYRRAAEGRDRMSRYYRRRLAAQMASMEGDRARYTEENREAARLAPGSKAAYNAAQGANQLRRPREALEWLATLDPDRPPMLGWPGYWSVLASAQHQVGDFEGYLATSREARRRFPEAVAPWYDEGAALAALGRIDEFDALVEGFERLDAPFDIFLVTMAAEADAHGQAELSGRLLDRAREVHAAMPADLAGQNGPRNWKAIAHYSRGELEEAEALFRELVRDNPDNDGWRAWVAAIAGQRGDRAAAEAEITRLLVSETPDDGGTPSLYAATIAAALGDGDRFADLIARAEAAGLLYSAWDHRHPLYRRIRSHPAYMAFITPRG